MCARFSLFATPAQIAQLLEIEVAEVAPRYNIAPTQLLLGAIERDGERQLREFRWGLIPSWAKDISIGNRMINARAETLLEKAAFRNAFERRRCVIPASGFFEWKQETIEEEVADASREGTSLFEEFDIPRRKLKLRTVKRPYFLTLASDEPFAFAGLYDYWRDAAGNLVRSCAILTTRPNELVAPLHDRMPVMLKKKDLELWLDCKDHAPSEVEPLLAPLPSEEMACSAASTLVNDPNNDSPAILTVPN